MVTDKRLRKAREEAVQRIFRGGAREERERSLEFLAMFCKPSGNGEVRNTTMAGLNHHFLIGDTSSKFFKWLGFPLSS